MTTSIISLQVNIAVHCLSTDFSNQKGVKVSDPEVLTGQMKKMFEPKIAIIVLSISLNMCFGCSKEYPQHMFWFKNKKKQLHTLIWGLNLELCLLMCVSYVFIIWVSKAAAFDKKE